MGIDGVDRFGSEHPKLESADPSQPAKPARSECARIPAADVGIILLLAAATGGAAFWGSCGLDALLVRGESGDVWFEADCPRVFQNATDRASVQSRSAVHPLFALCTYPLIAALSWVGGLEPIVALRVLRSLTAAACIAALYGLLRVIECRRLDSVLFSVLAGTSAGAMFWFVVPVLYPAGLLTILLALGLVGLGEGRRLSPVWDVLVNVATLAFTITNWMAGLLATLLRWPLRHALGIVLATVCSAVVLMSVQHQLFPSAALLPVSIEEGRYILPPEAGGPGRVFLSFTFHALVMPAIGTVARHAGAIGPIMTVQHSWPASAGLWSVLATVLWMVLLGLGVYGVCVCRRHRRLRIVLGLTIAGQLLLHLLYGLETFLYACHFGPLLVLVAAFATLLPIRRLVIALTIGLIVCAGVNNVRQLARARTFVQQRADARPSEPGAQATGQSGVYWHTEPLACARGSDLARDH